MNQTVTENHRLRDTIIIGAGLTGLTTAIALPVRDVISR